MRFSPGFVDQIRARLLPSQVLGRYMRLQSKAGGEHIALCPFHGDSKPSLTISDRKGFYHCFACGAHGDIVKFLTEHTGVSFPEAVKQLAEQAGIPLPKADPEMERKYQQQKTMHDVMEEACTWYQEQLQTAQGNAALSYLTNRGISEKMIAKFRLGFSPNNRSGVKQHLLGKNINESLIKATGLVIQPDDGLSYDRFRGRVMFPICDNRGKVIAFGGRILGDGEPKYLNSPETDLFHKGNVLYNFHLARDAAYRTESIAVAEGYMDVIALYGAGIKQAVAPLGTAITENQIRLLWQVAKEPVLCLDGDAAGRRAMARAAERCVPILQPGYSLKFAQLPKGQDPDDLIRREGKAAMLGLLKRATPLSEALWETVLHKINPSTPEKKAAFESELMNLVDIIQDKTVQSHYKSHYRDKIWQYFSGKKFSKKEQYKPVHVSLRQHKDPLEKYEHMLMNLILHCPSLLEDTEIMEEFSHFEPKNKQLIFLQTEMFAVSNPQEKTPAEYKEYLKNKGVESAIIYLEDQAFLDFHEDVAIAKEYWKYLMSCYDLTRMDEEYRFAVSTETEETSERVFALKKQKDLQEKQMHKYQFALDMALE